MVVESRGTRLGVRSTHGRNEKCTQNFFKKLESKKPLGRSAYRREDNIKINLKYIGCKGMDWIQLAQNSVYWRPLTNKIINLRIKNTGRGNVLIIRYFRRTLLNSLTVLFTALYVLKYCYKRLYLTIPCYSILACNYVYQPYNQLTENTPCLYSHMLNPQPFMGP